MDGWQVMEGFLGEAAPLLGSGPLHFSLSPLHSLLPSPCRKPHPFQPECVILVGRDGILPIQVVSNREQDVSWPAWALIVQFSWETHTGASGTGEGRHMGQIEASKQGSEWRKCPTRGHEMVSRGRGDSEAGLWAVESPGLPLGRAGDSCHHLEPQHF